MRRDVQELGGKVKAISVRLDGKPIAARLVCEDKLAYVELSRDQLDRLCSWWLEQAPAEAQQAEATGATQESEARGDDSSHGSL